MDQDVIPYLYIKSSQVSFFWTTFSTYTTFHMMNGWLVESLKVWRPLFRLYV